MWGGDGLDAKPVSATVEFEGRPFHRGAITCVLFGNLCDAGANLSLFDGSRADDGLLEFGVVSARSRWQWIRTLGRVTVRFETARCRASHPLSEPWLTACSASR